MKTISSCGTARADEIAHDQKDKLILVANGADTPPFATVIDARSRAVIAKIQFDDATAGLEQPVWDPETHLCRTAGPRVSLSGRSSSTSCSAATTRPRCR